MASRSMLVTLNVELGLKDRRKVGSKLIARELKPRRLELFNQKQLLCLFVALRLSVNRLLSP
jgi:hypothetical protein